MTQVDIFTIAIGVMVFGLLVASYALVRSYRGASDRVALRRDTALTRARLDGPCIGAFNRPGEN